MDGCIPTVRAADKAVGRHTRRLLGGLVSKPLLPSNASVQPGYTLVELLVAVALGSVVLASLGGVLLLSEVKVSANIQRNLDTKDAANRAIDLMRREAGFSRFFTRPSALPSAAGPLADCVNATPIAYLQRGDGIVCYKAVAPSDLPVVYQSAYQGPCVLVRLGPPYKPNGELDTSATPIAQVLLDGVARTPSVTTLCTSTRGFSVTMGSTSFNRNADVVITQASNATYSFSVRVPSNPAYDGNDLYDKCTSTSASGCGGVNELAYHFKPLMNSTTESKQGSPSRENIFYFRYPYSEYTLRGTSSAGSLCTYSSCFVQRSGAAVQLTNVDALIFSDREIRPSS
jgi:prepilin-type N-terminal cleavage/methylation domain-containing protein